MKQAKKLILCIGILFVLTACKDKDGLKTSVYETETGYLQLGTGLKQKIIVKYDKDGNVQKFKKQFTANYAEMGISKEEYDKDQKSADDYYDKIKGLKWTAKYGNKEAITTIDVIVKDLPERYFNVVFFFPADDSGNMTFKTLDDYYTQNGYAKH